MDFTRFQAAVSSKFDDMAKGDLFRVDISGDELWAKYLSSFPAGSNPMFRKRAEHDCSCCRHFIRSIGNVVAIVENPEGRHLTSIWDCFVRDSNYQAVAEAMHELVAARPIKDVFLHPDQIIGTKVNYESGEPVKEWNHFCVRVPRRNENSFFCSKAELDTKLGEKRTNYQVLFDGLTKIKPEALADVWQLIQDNQLYRGHENAKPMRAFMSTKNVFDSTPKKDLFIWSQLAELGWLARFKNTALGSLLLDISDGVDLEDAVKMYESKVAPQNYRRSTALVSQRQVDNARREITKLGLMPALERRFARLTDVSVRDVIFADRDARKMMRDSFDGIANKRKILKDAGKGSTYPIDEFVKLIVPHATTIELMLENRHANNLVSLIAPQEAAPASLFKWDNNFSWTYRGDVTDSIREKVKKAGGNVVGDLRCSLAWHNFDDLDLHMIEPGGYEIFYGTKLHASPYGGKLDVDMNVGGGRTREPVENIYYANKKTIKDGEYHLFVHQFNLRERDNVGFEVEIDWLGDNTHLIYDKMVRDSDRVSVAKLYFRNGVLVKLDAKLPSEKATKIIWGIKSNEWHRVSSMMLSPNHWGDSAIGNKHFFFMLADCRNDEPVRGFYNEFLKQELSPHRKVIEIVGAKMKIAPAQEQLSGLGFSSTLRNDILARVDGAGIVKVTF